jgi:hypothetical protein
MTDALTAVGYIIGWDSGRVSISVIRNPGRLLTPIFTLTGPREMLIVLIPSLHIPGLA